MAINNFPTSSDIYLEAKGKRIAVVQSYKARAVSSSTAVEAFGEREPVATIEGPRSYVIELTRLYATDSAITDGLDFYDLTDFSLVIVKPNRRTVYTGCRWAGIEETGELGKTIREKVTVVAARRVETQ
ncbi:MAG: hypothetical protein IJ259_05690 [Oscillospiraceae bacterium]|nr:hypothetical protein [Oscillospiraceae bacterium]MBQ8929154.1 hypothetical protein [Oscillospiraceae bacterium]MBR2716550.1 hypothetical protein [Oscillospiraceae bacterium]